MVVLVVSKSLAIIMHGYFTTNDTLASVGSHSLNLSRKISHPFIFLMTHYFIFENLFSYRLRRRHQSRLERSQNRLRREEGHSRRHLPQRRLHPIEGAPQLNAQVPRGSAPVQVYWNRGRRRQDELPSAHEVKVEGRDWPDGRY